MFGSRSLRTLLAVLLPTLALVCFRLLDSHGADRPSSPRHGMVVAVSPPGADVGRDILQKGGNAVDAAVATAFAMAVTYPAAGNIGGGGFMVVFPGKGTEPVVIEFRETAPAAASSTMFDKKDTWYTHKCVGVPGTVRGMELAHKKFGKLPWKDLVMPAVKLAEDGFILDEAHASSLNYGVSFTALPGDGPRPRQGRHRQLEQRRPHRPEGPGQDAAPHRRRRCGRLLQGADRRPARRRDEGGPRTDYQG